MLADALAVTRHELRVLRRTLTPILIMTLFPVVFMSLLLPSTDALLSAAGRSGGGGADQIVPGMSVLFSFFLVSIVGWTFWRDHEFGTWDRLRAAPLRPIEIVAGKILPLFGLSALQLTGLFAVGVAVFGLEIRGNPLALLPVGLALAFCLLALGMALVSLCRTSQQMNAAGVVSLIVLGTTGGTTIPVEFLPVWARLVAPVTPSFWAMRGLQAVIRDEGMRPVVLSVAVLGALGATLLAIALTRFDFEERKLF